MKVVKKDSLKNGRKNKIMPNYARGRENILRSSFLFYGILDIIVTGFVLAFLFGLPGWHRGKLFTIIFFIVIAVGVGLLCIIGWRKYNHPKKRK